MTKIFSWASIKLPGNNLNTRRIWFLVYCTWSILTWLKLAFKSPGSTPLRACGPQWLHSYSPLLPCWLPALNYLPGQVVKVAAIGLQVKGLERHSHHLPDPGFVKLMFLFLPFHVQLELSCLLLDGWLVASFRILILCHTQTSPRLISWQEIFVLTTRRDFPLYGALQGTLFCQHC